MPPFFPADQAGTHCCMYAVAAAFWALMAFMAWPSVRTPDVGRLQHTKQDHDVSEGGGLQGLCAATWTSK